MLGNSNMPPIIDFITDCEKDDLLSYLILILSKTLYDKAGKKNIELNVFASIGNEDISHLDKTEKATLIRGVAADKQKQVIKAAEMEKRVQVMRNIALAAKSKVTVNKGATAITDYCPDIANVIIKQVRNNPGRTIYLAVTAPIRPLERLLTLAIAQNVSLKNIRVVIYSSYNITKAYYKNQDSKMTFEEVVQLAKQHFGRVILINGHKTLGRYNKVLPKNTPNTIQALDNIGGKIGEYLLNFFRRSALDILEHQAQSAHTILDAITAKLGEGKAQFSFYLEEQFRKSWGFIKNKKLSEKNRTLFLKNKVFTEEDLEVKRRIYELATKPKVFEAFKQSFMTANKDLLTFLKKNKLNDKNATKPNFVFTTADPVLIKQYKHLISQLFYTFTKFFRSVYIYQNENSAEDEIYAKRLQGLLAAVVYEKSAPLADVLVAITVREMLLNKPFLMQQMGPVKFKKLKKYVETEEFGTTDPDFYYIDVEAKYKASQDYKVLVKELTADFRQSQKLSKTDKLSENQENQLQDKIKSAMAKKVNAIQQDLSSYTDKIVKDAIGVLPTQRPTLTASSTHMFVRKPLSTIAAKAKDEKKRPLFVTTSASQEHMEQPHASTTGMRLFTTADKTFAANNSSTSLPPSMRPRPPK